MIAAFVAGAFTAWTLVSLVIAVLVGKSIRLADDVEQPEQLYVPADWVTA